MEWLLENPNQIGAVGLMAFAFFALHKGYWVPGGTHRDCISRLTTLEQESKDTVTAKNAELDELKRAFYAREQTHERNREAR